MPFAASGIVSCDHCLAEDRSPLRRTRGSRAGLRKRGNAVTAPGKSDFGVDNRENEVRTSSGISLSTILSACPIVATRDSRRLPQIRMREIVLNESAPDYKKPFDSARDPGKVKGPRAFRGGDPARDSVCACVSDRETAIVLLIVVPRGTR